jgi:hypothetical protein
MHGETMKFNEAKVYMKTPIQIMPVSNDFSTVLMSGIMPT